MKTIHFANSFIGILNGALPPLMGSVAALGTAAFYDSKSWFLPALLALWQIPHFMALSYDVREEYHAAGFQMLSINSPPWAAFSSVLYSVLLLPTCWYFAFKQRENVNFLFHPISVALNGGYVYYSLKWQKNLTKANSNTLFRYSLFHMTALMTFSGASMIYNNFNICHPLTK
eukprot:TRINITY_DN142_c0_g2_i1.p1 TRINITY_DN142_c0_g2~~TRINITY_DN142_c0_g2_i1.p1  ORF type:complete len:173 (-),score=34.25 TRINITY_DN142_c0_g2_i1:160-678(-)